MNSNIISRRGFRAHPCRKPAFKNRSNYAYAINQKAFSNDPLFRLDK